MLGDQFRDTYTLEGPRGGARYYGPKDDGTLRESNRPLSGRAYQGMLFNPHVATETAKDPYVDRSERRELVRDTFRIKPPDEFDRYNAPERVAHQNQIIDAIVDSGLPNHEIRRIAEQGAPAIRDGRRPSAGATSAAGTYYSDEHAAYIATKDKAHLPNTVLHELGHGVHKPSHNGSNNNADPLYEGVADGYADRYERHAWDFPEAVSLAGGGTFRRRLTLTSGHDPHRGTKDSYGASYNGASWSAADRALYLAQRQHTALTGQVPRSDEHAQTWVENDWLDKDPGHYSMASPSTKNDTTRLILGRMASLPSSEGIADLPEHGRQMTSAQQHYDARQRTVAANRRKQQ